MCNQWKNSITQSPKLRTYILFKNYFHSEFYVQNLKNRQLRSLLAQFRCGILPLHIETGRIVNTPAHMRYCFICNEGRVEDEKHFLFECCKYDRVRQDFVNDISSHVVDFRLKNDDDKLRILMSDLFIKTTAIFLKNILDVRRTTLYTDV